MLVVTVIPFQLSQTEPWTVSKLNQGFNPTITVAGSTTDLTNFSTTPPTSGQILVWNAATSKWVPTNLPVSTTDTFNRIYAWAHFH
jgi:hypothetical protein